jgi:hypothetical protein
MGKLKGKPIWTFHGNEIREYKVLGVTYKPVKKQRVAGRTMVEYFLEKYNIRLEKLDWPCFITSENLIPAELSFIDKT